jgi:Oxidoreductase molybdopterin binding domain
MNTASNPSSAEVPEPVKTTLPESPPAATPTAANADELTRAEIKLESDGNPESSERLEPLQPVELVNPSAYLETATETIEAGTAKTEASEKSFEQPETAPKSEEAQAPADLNPTHSDLPHSASSDVKKDFARQSRRSFLVFGAAAVGGFSGFRWLQGTSTDGGVHWPLRKGLNASSALQRAVLGDSATVATHAKSEAREVRRNGSEGVKVPLGPNDNQQTWTIEVQRNGIRMGTLRLADLLKLPRVEQTVDHKCVEGWSQVVTWEGVKMADVLARAEELVEGKRAEHIGFATPDKGYYVTLERSAVKHRQTLLALSLNGEELTDKHGAPCRLAVPTRYGIKSIKRVGIINLSDSHASDYWGQRGYDLYAAF